MNAPSDLNAKFARAFADAVIAFQATGLVQAVEFDAFLKDYVHGPVEDGTAPEDVGTWVGANWGYLTGPIAAQENPKAAGYDPEKLRAELVHAAQESPLLLELAEITAERSQAG